MDLVRRRDEDRDGPMGRLADRFSISEDELECLWSIVAVSCDPRFAITLDALWPGRRGLPIAAYAHVRGTSAVIGRDLARWLATANPLVTSGLVGVVDDALPIAARSYTASARLIAHLAGDDEPADGVARIERPGALLVDDAGQRVLAELAKLLAGPPVAIVIEGPRASGRSTAIAASTERTVVELDVDDRRPVTDRARGRTRHRDPDHREHRRARGDRRSCVSRRGGTIWPGGQFRPVASIPWRATRSASPVARAGVDARGVFGPSGARCASWSDANAGVHRRDRGGRRRVRVDVGWTRSSGAERWGRGGFELSASAAAVSRRA